MTLATLKRTVRRIRRRLGLGAKSSQPTEAQESYYDTAFDQDPHYHVPFYKSSYYATWLVIVDRLRRYGRDRILDVGCGPGQFASLIADSGFRSYTGIDFSTVATRRAREQTPQFQFRTGDVRELATYAGLDFNAIVCMEVLEHIEEDFEVLACFPPGTRCLMTVPNFPWRSHVRHFESEESVIRRYGEFFDDLTVTRLKGVRNETEQFYLLDGVRNPVARGPKERGARS